MYRSSAQYKDACEIGKIEYSAAYRSLLNWIRIKQKGINIPQILQNDKWNEIIIVGAGDLCELLIDEFKGSSVKVSGILDDNLKKYGNKYRNYGIKSVSEVDISFLQGKKLIVTYMDKYNSYVEKLSCKGISVDSILSIEELVAYILLKERAQ